MIDEGVGELGSEGVRGYRVTRPSREGYDYHVATMAASLMTEARFDQAESRLDRLEVIVADNSMIS